MSHNHTPIFHRPLKQSIAIALMAGVFSSSAFALTTEQRLERLERMANNPVTLKLTQQLNQQKRELQSVQNRLDLIQHKLPEQNASLNRSDFEDRLAKLEAQQNQQSERLARIESMLKLLVQAQTQSTNLPAGKVSDGFNNNQPNLKMNHNDSMPISQEHEEGKTSQKASSESTKTIEPLKGVVKTRLATKSEDEAYQAAFELMRKSKYEASISAFIDFAQQHPESSLAPNAWYWAGEGQYILKDNEKAKLSFEKIVKHYPEASKTSDAKLRLADALSNLNQEGEAKELYRDIVKNHAGSRAAENAQSRLDKLQ